MHHGPLNFVKQLIKNDNAHDFTATNQMYL